MLWGCCKKLGNTEPDMALKNGVIHWFLYFWWWMVAQGGRRGGGGGTGDECFWGVPKTQKYKT